MACLKCALAKEDPAILQQKRLHSASTIDKPERRNPMKGTETSKLLGNIDIGPSTCFQVTNEESGDFGVRKV